jgi:hypothetical protein
VTNGSTDLRSPAKNEMDDKGAAIRRDAEERRAVRRTTVDRRLAYTDARRAANRERDAERLRLAHRFAALPGPHIPRDDGYLMLPAGTFSDLVEPVLVAGNGVIDEIGHQALVEHGGKSDFIARGFLPDTAFAIDSPYFRLALDERIVGPISAYLGVVPVLTEIDVWYSVHQPNAPKRSQLWHMDSDDTTLIKLWVHLSEVDRRSGPLTAFSASDSARLADAVAYNYDDGYRVPDDRVNDVLGAARQVVMTGPRGTVDFIDTCRCFHFGSRVSEDGDPRRLLMVEYQTPYAFEFSNYRKEARYRTLAPAAASDLQRLLLGGA